MLKLKKTMVVTATLVTGVLPLQAAECEKYKSEIFTVGWKANEYRQLLDKKANGLLDQAHWVDEAEGLVRDLQELREYVQTSTACPAADGTFENRKQTLISVLNVAIPAMRAGEVLKVVF